MTSSPELTVTLRIPNAQVLFGVTIRPAFVEQCIRKGREVKMPQPVSRAVCEANEGEDIRVHKEWLTRSRTHTIHTQGYGVKHNKCPHSDGLEETVTMSSKQMHMQLTHTYTHTHIIKDKTAILYGRTEREEKASQREKSQSLEHARTRRTQQTVCGSAKLHPAPDGTRVTGREKMRTESEWADQ